MKGVVKSYKEGLNILGEVSEFRRLQQMLSEELEELIPRNLEPRKLAQSAWYIIDSGKRIRPMLTALSCMAVGGDMKSAVRIAVACELLHTVSLIHDDIIDNDDIRRGKQSLHRQFGLSVALITANLLFGKAFEEIAQSASHLSSEKALRLVLLASRTCSFACAGEMRDISFSYQSPLDQYLLTIEGKTAHPMKAVVEAGAICGGGTEEEIQALSQYGKNLGMAYQIIDDILGIQSSKKRLGKSIWIDVRENRPNVVVTLAGGDLSSTEREELLRILGKKNRADSEVKKCVRMMKTTGALDEAQRLAASYVSKAEENISLLKDSKAKRALKIIATYVLKRTR